MILTRDQWIEWLLTVFVDVRMAADDSIVWYPEEDIEPCQMFVYHKCLNLSEQEIKSEYYDWCWKNLKGRVRCFWSNPEIDREWWGFTEPDDIVWWLLKWS